MVQNILDMALARIRSNNTEFRNATLTGAQIRVRGGLDRNPLNQGSLAMLMGREEHVQS